MKQFSLSANIENGFPDGMQYIVTPNARKAIGTIIDDYHTGIHSFTIIGSYGTGKSSFLLALEEDLRTSTRLKHLFNPKSISDAEEYEQLNIVGDYADLSKLLRQALRVEGGAESVIDELKSYYQYLHAHGKFLVIVVDEFGKVLEHAAKNNPEQELYFMQKLAEFVNVPSRQILLLTTLHQNFSSYARGLSEAQRNEWTKVKGRFKEITFVEPIEQILYLASSQHMSHIEQKNIKEIFLLAHDTKFVSSAFAYETAKNLSPLDPFSAFAITSAIQRYGQNERSLFTFLVAKGKNSLSEFTPGANLTYNLERVYDYIIYNFYSYLKDANTDSMAWSSIQLSIERAEGLDWDSEQSLMNAIKLIKAIGLLNLFSIATFQLTAEQMSLYAKLAMDIPDASVILHKLEQFKIIRFAAYKQRLLLFEGTDVDLELEIRQATNIVPRPVSYIVDLEKYFVNRISPVKAHFYQRGTPRYFEYMIREEPIDIVPTGDTDGVIELIFSDKDTLLDVRNFSANNDHALIFAYFDNADDIIQHLHRIKVYENIAEKVLIDKSDRVANQEIARLKTYEETLLVKAISSNLFEYTKNVKWFFRGEEKKIHSLLDFNKLLSEVCDNVYSLTPVMNNELFNRHKLPGTISSARVKYLTALLNHYNEPELGFESDKFPPEKTIYYSLLKNTGLHRNGTLSDEPNNPEFMSVWKACEDFLHSTVSKPRKVSALIKMLSEQPYKLKQGFLDFWVPTYLFIRRQDFALYSASKGAFIPEVNMEFFDLLPKHPADFELKAYAVDGVKLSFFNQYRQFVRLGEEQSITTEKFIETIKPFFFFYRQLNDYAKHTQKFDHSSTLRFRDVLATAKDPEKAFFEDLPEALGYNRKSLEQEKFVNEYGNIIQRAIRELRSCYTKLIDRIEERLVEGLKLDSAEYGEYIHEVRGRLGNTKVYLMTDRQREFYTHAITEYDNRAEWYQSICYTVLDQRLDTLRDEQEDKLLDDLVYMFRSCEKYADISRKTDESDKSDAYSFDMVTNRGTDVRTQTYILPEKDRQQAVALEARINKLLSGDINVDVCTLLSILNKKITK